MNDREQARARQTPECLLAQEWASFSRAELFEHVWILAELRRAAHIRANLPTDETLSLSSLTCAFVGLPSYTPEAPDTTRSAASVIFFAIKDIGFPPQWFCCQHAAAMAVLKLDPSAAKSTSHQCTCQSTCKMPFRSPCLQSQASASILHPGCSGKPFLCRPLLSIRHLYKTRTRTPSAGHC